MNRPSESTIAQSYSHYFREVPYSHVDVYRVLQLFGVSDPCIQHAVKKLLAAGERGGAKDAAKDISEAIVSLRRWEQMRDEEQHVQDQKTIHPANRRK